MKSLEHFHKYCNHSASRLKQRFFWLLASFSLSHRPLAGMLLRSSLAKTQNSSLPNGYSICSNALACLLLAGVALVAGGCASPNINPKTAQRGMGYVDFYADDADNLFWDVTDLKTGKKLYNVFDPLNDSILRLALKPGQYELQVTFGNHIIDAPGTVDVDVQDGMITPVTVTLLPSGEALFKTKSTGWGSTYFGVYGRRTMITEHPSPSYEVGLDPRDPLPYQPKAQMPYFQRPAE